MNIIDLQESLKDYPDSKLMNEMQRPSGNLPQFLVLGELQRRKRMRDDFKRREAADMPTVAEEMITGPAKTMKNKPIRTMITNVFEDVQSKADDMFGAAQDIAGDIAKQEDKLKFITKEVAKKLPKLAIGGIDPIKKIGFAMLFGGPSTMGADLIPESVLNDMADDLGVKEKEPMTFAGGGMAMIDDMIKPVGV